MNKVDRLTEVLEYTIVEGDDLDFLKDQLTAAKEEIEGLRTVTESFGQGADAVKHMTQEILDGRRLQSQVSDTKEEIAVLTFKVSNVTTERDVAWQEIGKLRERWNKASDLAGHNLDERESLIRQLSDAEKEIEKLKLRMQQEMEEYAEALQGHTRQIAAANTENGELKKLNHQFFDDYKDVADAVKEYDADLTAAKVEIEQLKDVAIKLQQATCDDAALLIAANLEIERINRIAEEELDEVNGKVEQLGIEITRLRQTFGHYHVNNHENDACHKCALDLRDEIHWRIADTEDK